MIYYSKISEQKSNLRPYIICSKLFAMFLS